MARDYTEFTALEGLDRLVEEYQALSDMIKGLQDEKTQLADRISERLHEVQDETVTCRGFSVIWVKPAVSQRLSKEKLVELGVAPATIQAAMVESHRPGHLQVRANKNGGDE